MKLSSNITRKKAKIEIIPLIDVVFLLLIFFIYTMLSLSVNEEITIDLPNAPGKKQEVKKYLQIVITKENQIYFDDTKMDMAQLEKLLRQRTVSNKEIPVFVRGDRESHLEVSIQVLEILQKLQMKKVSFACSKGAGN